MTATSGSVTNTVTVTPPAGTTDPTPPGNVTDTDTVTPIADLTLTKSNGVTSVTAGGTTAYTIVLSNNGPSAADGSVVRDPAAAGLAKTSVTCAPAGGAVCPAVTVANFESGVTVPTLPSGGSLTFTVNANVTATSGSVTNTVTVTPPAGTTDPTPPGNVTDTDTVTPIADLTLTKSNGVTSVTAGGTTAYTIVLSNNGPSAADGSVVRDPAATGLAKTSVTCAPAGGAVCPTVTVTSFESGVTVPTLPSGGSLTFTVNANVTATSGSVTNTVTVTPPAGTTDPTPPGNVTDTDTVTELADLAVVKTVNPANPPIGSVVAFTITVSNATGPSAASGVVVNDTLPSGYAFVSATASVGSYNSGVWTVGTLAVGGSETLTINARVLETGTYANTATVTATTADPTPGNNTSTATPTPVANPSLRLVKDAPTNADNDGSGTVTLGDVLTYRVTATNNGNVTLNNVMVSDPQLTPNSNTCATLAVNADCVLTGTHTVTLGDVNNGSIVNTAQVTSNEVTTPVTATVTTPVARRPIVATGDSGGVASGAAGGTAVANVLVNDTLNGQPATTGTVTISQVSTTNPNITIDPASGAVNVAAGTPTGNYVLRYRICEIADPTNCSEADVAVQVANAAIDAVNDTGTQVNGRTGGTAYPDVRNNDLLDGAIVNPAAVTIVQVSSSNPGVTLNTTTGAVNVAPGTPVGNYTLVYRLCEVLNPGNCDEATVTVPVAAAPIDAVNDTGASVNGRTGGVSVADVRSNDTLGGTAVNPADVTLRQVSTTNPNVTLNISTGAVSVAPGTPVGTYTLTYELCEVLNPTNCDQATVTVEVTAAPIDAVNDTGASVNGRTGGVSVPDVRSNDTLGGNPVNPADVTLRQVSTSNPNVTLNTSTGAVSVAPGTPVGTYTLTYELCELLNPANCDQATVTVEVTAAPIDAVNDTGASVNGRTGGVSVADVRSNDTLGGNPVNPADVTLRQVSTSNPNVTLNTSTGAVSVAPGTPVGTYTLTYELCELLNPSNCDQATVTVEVTAAPIDAVNDTGAQINGRTGGVSVADVRSNDTLNGTVVNPADVTLRQVSTTNPNVTLDTSTGAVSVAPGTPAGTYTLTYELCEALNPANCDQATVTVEVTAAPIDAVNDAGTPVDGRTGGIVVPNVLSNDTLNGNPVNPADVVLTQVSSSNPNVTVNPATGAVSVAPGTPAGSYTLTYQICEALNPSNCDQATVTVTVSAAAIDAVDDVVATPVNGNTGGSNVVNVLGNDTLGGSAVNPADVTVKPNSNGPLTVKADGNVDVAPNTPAGTYTVTYQLCEVLNPSNCDTATVTITVSAPAITATDDPAGGSGVTPQNTPVTTNVIANDTLNGAPIDPNLVTITVSTDANNGTTVVNSDGTITYTPRPNFSGDDVYTYTICEKLNPTNCATAKVNVTVQPNKVTANPDTAQTNQQTPVTINVIGNDTVTSAPLDPASVTIVGQPANGTVTCTAGSCTYTPKQFFAGTDSFTYRVCDTSSPTPVCATATVTIKVIANAPVLRLVKTSAVREVKIGDLVRYSVLVENVGDSPAVNATLVDIPPAGFTFVDNSLTVDDDNKSGVVMSANPLRIGGIDVAIGGKATVSYFLRVGAGVGKGTHKNQVAGYDEQGTKISNDATAEVTMAGDPLLEDSLLVGSVFDDRDGDGWQDPAKATGVRVQGGFAPGAYVAGSTTVDSGEGPVAEPDASAPMLHGIALGRIDGRGSAAAPAREVTVRQTLSELAFSDDFVLTTDEGTTVRMGADGRTTVERTRGDAAKGLTGQDLQVVRNVSQGANGYVVSYTIRNNGIEERGIPGVRIASVEGLIMETDAYGRYHLEGIDGGNAARGRNFILKVDPATLPPGSVFTTENPRVRRITQGIPTRFDFGVKLPPGEVSGTKSETDVELGEVMFESGSATVKPSYAPMFEQIAARLRDAGGGSVTVAAQAEEEALAFARARAVQAALLKQIEGDPALASKVKVDVVAGTDATLVSLDPAIRLGEVLFDTDQSTIKPQYRALIGEIAKTLNQQGSGAIGIVGRADKRGAAAYNVQLGLRRAKAVFEAISAELKPEVRQKVRVDITDDTQAPVGVGNR
ncbi:Ig-like domain-containing protein [Lysobacter enzymogenes]|uniref:Ig-like domain-containing protein n=1 Tax=Lysobacter enzymogenes TaxID=69 RepID=UPI003850AB04